MYKVLELFEFLVEFITMVRNWYKTTKALVYTNDVLSNNFLLSRGTTIKPLAKKIRQTENISVITIGKNEYTLSLFTDDLLGLSNVDTSVPRLI